MRGSMHPSRKRTAHGAQSPAERSIQRHDRQALAEAIMQTVIYADIFDYPLTPSEIHRYLIGMRSSVAQVSTMLDSRTLRPLLSRQGAYITLQGRESIVALRQHRLEIAARLWPRASRYGRLLSRIPFVRMVAVTGTLAVDNVEAGDDIDVLIVTAVERLWLCRLLVIALVRLVATSGDVLCPNYFLSERALTLSEHTIYTAHELAQMVPLYGQRTYDRMRQLNNWTATLLPNATAAPHGGA